MSKSTPKIFTYDFHVLINLRTGEVENVVIEGVTDNGIAELIEEQFVSNASDPLGDIAFYDQGWVVARLKGTAPMPPKPTFAVVEQHGAAKPKRQKKPRGSGLLRLA